MLTIPCLRITVIYDFSHTNTVNIVHKLVTVFAGHLDSFIVINNHFIHLISTATSGSGQISVQMTLIQFAGTCKNCAIPVLYRDSFLGLTGQCPGRLLHQVTFTKLYCRAVIFKPIPTRQVHTKIFISNLSLKMQSFNYKS
jgi:hypothetical protein